MPVSGGGRRRQWGRVRRLPSGRWQARYKDAAGRERPAPVTFATKADAARYLARVQVELEDGEWRDPDLGRTTFAEWAAGYLDGGSRHKRPTTRARDEVVARTHLIPALGARPLATITPADVRRVVDAMAARLAPATVRTNYGVLKAILNAAVEADVLARSPCRGVKLPAADADAGASAHRRRAEEQRRTARTPDDLRRLADALPAEYRPVAYVAGVLGLRWSEVAGLRVGRLDLAARTLTVAETTAEVNGRLVPAADAKSRAGRRTLAVPAFLADLLAEHLARRGDPGPEELVFVAPRGGPLRATNFRTRVWAPAVAAAGLEGLTFHGLRHVATSLMVDVGEHPRVIQHRIGHATARMSLERYAHVSEAADRAAAAHLEAMFASARGAKKPRRATEEEHDDPTSASGEGSPPR